MDDGWLSYEAYNSAVRLWERSYLGRGSFELRSVEESVHIKVTSLFPVVSHLLLGAQHAVRKVNQPFGIAYDWESSWKLEMSFILLALGTPDPLEWGFG